MDGMKEDDYLAYVDNLLSEVEALQSRLSKISYTKVETVPAGRVGRPLKYGKSSRVFSVRLPIDYVAMLIDSCARAGLSPSEYIIRHLDLL